MVRKYAGMRIRNGLLGTFAALALGLSLSSPCRAESIDILRAVPLEVSGYASGKGFPEYFQSADEVLKAIDSSPVLLVHMEALRRGYHDLSDTEQDKVLSTLMKRHKANEKDLQLGFDYGYAQLVYKENKTGLFFLRKANDKFQSQFSSLAYGMAEVQADLNLENSTPAEMTTRKLDATFQLSDAVKRDAADHQPGFWPSFIKVIDKLKPLPAYASFSRRDFSLAYVPYAPRTVAPLKIDTTSSTLPLQSTPGALLSNSINTSCNPDGVEADKQESDSAANAPVSQRSAAFSGSNASIQFFPTEETHLYRVRVLSASGQPMLSFKSYAMPTIVEDLDGDGTLEIVARQYQYDPLHPVLVYRYTPCGFELDKKIFNDFQ
jgi:hypothetical protein